MLYLPPTAGVFGGDCRLFSSFADLIGESPLQFPQLCAKFGYMIRLFRNLALLLLVILLAAACGTTSRRHITATMDDVESYVNDRPDSALAVLEGVDSTALNTRALRARYSLLHVMAQAKCYKDLTIPGLIDDAAIWYAHHGSADERMKTLYYQGCIAQANGDQNSAAVYYARAEEYVDNVTDKHALGLLYLAEASVYNAVYNTDIEKEYREKALSVFKQNQDSMYDSALGGLAYVYHSRKEWQKADSLYRHAILHSEAYPHALGLYLSNYARMKVQQPDKDPEGTIELLNRKRELSGGGLTLSEAGAYAYASELLGQTSVSDALIAKLQEASESRPIEVYPWLSRISEARGDYKSALAYQAEAHRLESKHIESVLSDSVTQALREEANGQAERARFHTQRTVLAAGVVIFALLSTILMGLLRRRRVEEEMKRLISIREQLQAELESNELVVSGQQDRLLEMEQKVARERESYTRERVRRLRQLGELRSTFWWRERQGIGEKEAVKQIKEEIAYVFQTDNDGIVLVRRLDKELDGAVSRLRKELHLRGNPREVLFICCCILDLEPELIAEIMATTKANVYEKRSRLRARIRALGDPLLSVLVEKN